MNPYILSCMLAAALEPAQHPAPLECERAYVSLERCQNALGAVEIKWAPVCYAPTRLAVQARACQPTNAEGTEGNLFWLLEAK
jgi:hypothetical protein